MGWWPRAVCEVTCISSLPFNLPPPSSLLSFPHTSLLRLLCPSFLPDSSSHIPFLISSFLPPPPAFSTSPISAYWPPPPPFPLCFLLPLTISVSLLSILQNPSFFLISVLFPSSFLSLSSSYLPSYFSHFSSLLLSPLMLILPTFLSSLLLFLLPIPFLRSLVPRHPSLLHLPLLSSLVCSSATPSHALPLPSSPPADKTPNSYPSQPPTTPSPPPNTAIPSLKSMAVDFAGIYMTQTLIQCPWW